MSAARKLGLKAARPTFEAAPQQLAMAKVGRLAPQRMLARSRSLLEMIRQARDFNPDVAKAVDNVVTLANPGYDLHVYHASGPRAEPRPDPEGLRLIRQFCIRMHSEYSGTSDFLAGKDSVLSGLDSFVNMVHLMAMTFGGAAAEVELSEDLSDIVDVYPVDPSIIDFRRNPDTLRLEPGIAYYGPFVPLDPVRFRYIGKDPDVNAPAGRAPLMSVLDTVNFQNEFLRELKAVVHQNNMPRLDVKVIEETALNAIKTTRPDLDAPGQEDNLRSQLDSFLTDLQGVVNSLEADDAFVHWDAVEVDYVKPGMTAIPVEQIMSAIGIMMVSATKQLPVLLGRNEGASTTHATVQWQVYVMQLLGYQRISAALVTWLLNLYLRVIGRNSYVVFEYKAHRTSDDLADAQALSAKIAAWEKLVALGWATADEAAQTVVGHPAVGEPLPLPDPKKPASDPGEPAADGEKADLVALAWPFVEVDRAPE